MQARACLALLLTGLFAGAVILLGGCELTTDSADADINIEPASVVLKQGQSAEFVASGGYEYRWSLDPEDGTGRLSTRKGDRTVYTCLSTSGTQPKKIVVVSYIPGEASGEAGTNVVTTVYSETAYAYVYHPGGSVPSTPTTTTTTTTVP